MISNSLQSSNTGLLYADDELGNVPTDAEKAKLAQHIGQTDYGFQEHTVAPDTATNQAIQGVGYTGSGAAPAGSQFSSTGEGVIDLLDVYSEKNGVTGAKSRPETRFVKIVDEMHGLLRLILSGRPEVNYEDHRKGRSEYETKPVY